MQPKKLQLKKFEWRYPTWVDNVSPKAMCTSAWYKILPYRVLVMDAQESSLLPVLLVALELDVEAVLLKTLYILVTEHIKKSHWKYDGGFIHAR